MTIGKEYIIIFSNEEAGQIEFTESDEWDTDPNEEFYGYYKCEINGWKIIKQSSFILDSGDEESVCHDINMSKRIFIQYNKLEPTIILACSHEKCWRKCFDTVYTKRDGPYSNEEWREIIKNCIRNSSF